MQTLIDNPQRAAQMGVKAEQRYQEMFTAERMAKNYLRLYQELLGNADSAKQRTLAADDMQESAGTSR